MAGMGREKQKRWLTYFLRMTRENFMYNFQNTELNYMTQKEEDFARNFADCFKVFIRNVVKGIAMIGKADSDYAYS